MDMKLSILGNVVYWMGRSALAGQTEIAYLLFAAAVMGIALIICPMPKEQDHETGD